MGIARFRGQLPKPFLIDMAQEPACAGGYPGPVPANVVSTESDGALANVIVYISEGLGERRFNPPTQPAVIDQRGCFFYPHVLAMQANQKLQVLNSDTTMHNVHPLPAKNRSWNRSQLESMPPIETTFALEEIAIPMKCDVHPWMRSYIAVFHHPYFAVTGEDGSFELRNLPPGTYTLSGWHEQLGTSDQKINLGPDQTIKVDFTFTPKGQ